MNIYLIRHSKAEVASPDKKDKDRELTEAGIDLIKQAAVQWKSRIEGFDFLFTSPLIRAVQTAHQIIVEIKTANDVVIDNSLSPGNHADTIIQIADACESEDVAFVGHQPDMGYIISRFVSSYDVNLKFSPATIAKISFKGKPKFEKGKLEFLLPPIL